jgi:RNA polymerase sigma factor (sigma-70 family)
MTSADSDEQGLEGPLSTASFEVLYPRLRRFAAVVADRDVDPDDLVQESVTAYLRRFEGTSGADDPEAYLRLGIVSAGRNHRRTVGRRRRREADDDHRDVVRDQYPSDVAALLERTTPTERALLWLVDIEGTPINEACRTLQLSAVAARARLSRARRRLRTDLAKEHQG